MSAIDAVALAPETERALEQLLWIRELKLAEIRRDRRAQFVAAEKVCELFNVAPALRAAWSNGFLRLPPAWPLVDAVPYGGARGLVTFVVRSMIDGIRREVKIGIAPGKPGQNADAIEEGVRRGRFELRRLYVDA